MSLQEKAAQTTRKLLALTQDRLIEWDKITDTRSITRGTDDDVEVAYEASVQGTDFVIYEASYRTSDDGERIYWNSRVCVDMVDGSGIRIWQLPESPGMWDLLEAVKVSEGNIEGKLDDFLDD